jgi:Fur family ferric uptake transcriptional regulator
VLNGSELTLPQVLGTMQKAGYKITPARRVVIETVLGKDRHFSVADLVAEVVATDHSVGRATVFRTLDMLVDLGVIGRVHRPGGGQGYVVCPTGHHHHAICSRCGLVLDLPGCPLSPEAEKDASAAGFRLQGHRLEYYGLCQACQTKGND